ncbi:hypothetical protein OJ253_3731, partial [Cryptosporidium canis]
MASAWGSSCSFRGRVAFPLVFVLAGGRGRGPHSVGLELDNEGLGQVDDPLVGNQVPLEHAVEYLVIVPVVVGGVDEGGHQHAREQRPQDPDLFKGKQSPDERQEREGVGVVRESHVELCTKHGNRVHREKASRLAENGRERQKEAEQTRVDLEGDAQDEAHDDVSVLHDSVRPEVPKLVVIVSLGLRAEYRLNPLDLVKELG